MLHSVFKLFPAALLTESTKSSPHDPIVLCRYAAVQLEEKGGDLVSRQQQPLPEPSCDNSLDLPESVMLTNFKDLRGNAGENVCHKDQPVTIDRESTKFLNTIVPAQ